MKQKFLIGLMLISSMLVAQVAPQRVPARRGIFVTEQPNGDTLHIQLVGDEWWHARLTADGYIVEQNDQDYWCYAKWSCLTYKDKNGHRHHKTKTSKYIAKDADQRTAKETKWLERHGARLGSDDSHRCPRRIVMGDPRTPNIDSLMALDREERIAQARRIAMSNPGICTRTIVPRILVIMVNFKDYAFSTTKEHADSLFNAVTPLTTQVKADGSYYMHGSVAEYFQDQSLGQYRPRFDVVGPVTLNKSYTDFPGSSYGGSLANLACTAVNDSVDFTQYDSDKDGYIDLVFIFYAGFGQNDATYIDKGFGITTSSLIWPHYSTSASGKFDGKTLRAYECSNELDGYFSKADPKFLVPAGSGILVHEYSHGMGLPDVYSGSTMYMGRWDLMDYGCYGGDGYVPSPYTGWQRWFMDWSKPHFLNSAEDVTLRPISESGEFGVITKDGQRCDSMNTTAYWIVENHQQVGWDQYAFGEGLIAYQLKYHSGWRSNSVNSESNKSYVLVPADGTLRYGGGYVGKQGDCYPYGALDSITTLAPAYPITAIRQETNGDITFKVCGGDPQPTEVEYGIWNMEYGVWRKELRNGQLILIRDNQEYDILGR